jgi:hypothetical protein
MSMREELAVALTAIKSDDLFSVAKARAMVTVYDAVWCNNWSAYQVVDVEREFAFPLLNPETEGTSRSFSEAGKMDALLRRRSDGKLIVLEHKTTSDDVAPESNYWDRLRMDTQVSKYFLGALQTGQDVGGVIYDVMGKPGQRQAQIPLRDEAGSKIVLDANGNRVRTKDGKKWRETGDTEAGYVVQTRPETPEEFETRVLGVLRENPFNFYAQKEIARLDSDILEYMSDAWQLSQQILYFRKQQLWPRNPNACNAYNRTCEFFDLCSGRASVDGIRFAKTKSAHNELKIQSDGERQLLTNSRSSSLRRCARHHFLHYEEQVRKIQDDEASEALRLGTLVHLGLEAYFNHLKNTQN